MLNIDDTIQGTFKGPVRVGKRLGVGGQGAVHHGTTEDGREVAIKWYLPGFQKDDLRYGITELVKQEAPSTHFLWPEDIVTKGDEFGYVMRLRPPGYANVPQLLARKIDDVTFRVLAQAANQTVSAFNALQKMGLFYSDISDGNLFFNPTTGDVLICDNDNVGSARDKPRVLGTPRFMAPEIVRGEASPSASTDRFSMAVLLFLLLFNDHPFHGAAETAIRCFDAAAMNKLYGTNPVFIFDPDDTSNRPVPGVHINAPIFWGMYPQKLKDVFTEVFTAGLREPGARPGFGRWQAALAEVEDSIVPCTCGAQAFLRHDGSTTTCWSCRRPIEPPMRLVIDGRRTVVLNNDTKLYEHHLSKRGGDPGARGEPLAEVVKHPTKDVWGLRNLGTGQWFAKVADGTGQSVDPQRSATLRPGTEISFGGDVAGTIVA